MLARFTRALLPALLVLGMLGAPALAVAQETVANPFIPGENIGQMTESSDGTVTKAGEAQKTVTGVVSCSVYTIWAWVLKPLVIVIVVLFGVLRNLFMAVKGGDSASLAQVGYSVLFLMMLFKAEFIRGVLEKTPLNSAVTALYLNNKCAASNSALRQEFTTSVEAGNLRTTDNDSLARNPYPEPNIPAPVPPPAPPPSGGTPGCGGPAALPCP